METNLLKGHDKVQQICNALKTETLEPAKIEAERLVNEAKKEAHKIIEEAKAQRDQILIKAKQTIEKERVVFLSTLDQAGKQSIEKLKQDIETKLFNEEMLTLISKEVINPKIIAKIIETLVVAIEKEGLSANLEALIPKTVNAKEVIAFLGDEILSKLKEKSLSFGEFRGGVKIKLLDNKMTLDFSEEALFELLSSYVQKDYRKLIFKK